MPRQFGFFLLAYDRSPAYQANQQGTKGTIRGSCPVLPIGYAVGVLLAYGVVAARST
jgi:hypothetical protein